MSLKCYRIQNIYHNEQLETENLKITLFIIFSTNETGIEYTGSICYQLQNMTQEIEENLNKWMANHINGVKDSA